MGPIKTAMMGGAGVYGIHQISKAAATRNSNSNSNDSAHHCQECTGHARREASTSTPLEFGAREQHQQSSGTNRNFPDPDLAQDSQSKQRSYLEERGYSEAQPYSDQTPYYEYAANTRSIPAEAQYYSGQHGPQGFVEPEEAGRSKADMLRNLALQSMGMGMVGGGRKKGKKGGPLTSLLSK